MAIIRDKQDVVIDHYTGQEIMRPSIESKLLYDFDFRKSPQNLWRYVNSSNDITAFTKQFERVEKCKGQYRIVMARTGAVIKTNKKW